MKVLLSTWKVRFSAVVLAFFFLSAFATAEENTYDKAVRAYAKKDFKTAAKYLKEYVEKKPDPNAYYLLGYSLYKIKNHTDSARYFKEAYTLDPNITLTHFRAKKKL
jgi:TolA-binding protein